MLTGFFNILWNGFLSFVFLIFPTPPLISCRFQSKSFRSKSLLKHSTRKFDSMTIAVG